MNVMHVIAEARATALSLRASARACGSEQGALKFRLKRAAASLDSVALLAVRRFDRIEHLERQIAAANGGRVESAERGTQDGLAPYGLPIAAIAPVIVAGVDVGPLTTAASIIGIVEGASGDEWISEGFALRASLRVAHALLQETLDELRAASARGAS